MTHLYQTGNTHDSVTTDRRIAHVGITSRFKVLPEINNDLPLTAIRQIET